MVPTSLLFADCNCFEIDAIRCEGSGGLIGLFGCNTKQGEAIGCDVMQRI